MKSAATVLVCHPENATLFLAISRRNDNTRWGFPGGKVDPGESNVHAALREFEEEVGVRLTEQALEPVYSGICYGTGPADTYWGTTYFWTGAFKGISACTPEAGLELAWGCEAFHTSTKNSPFAAYNREMFRAFSAYAKARK